jgi:hypothetical protein
MKYDIRGGRLRIRSYDLKELNELLLDLKNLNSRIFDLCDKVAQDLRSKSVELALREEAQQGLQDRSSTVVGRNRAVLGAK